MKPTNKFRLHFFPRAVQVSDESGRVLGAMLIIGQKAKNRHVAGAVCEKIFGPASAKRACREINRLSREGFYGDTTLELGARR